MNRRVTNHLGEFEYQTTPLELFVEELTREWRVKLSDLQPPSDFSAIVPHYELIIRGHLDGTASIKYFRTGKEPNVSESDNLRFQAERLYSSSSLEAECVFLERGNKQVYIRVEPGRVTVTFKDIGAINALRKTETEGLTNYLVRRTDATMKFQNTATSGNPRKPNPLGDMQAAFSVIRNYFSKQ